MIITINEETLTAIIVDDADAPTKQCVLGNWNPDTRKKWLSVQQLQAYAESIQGNDNFFSEIIAEEPVAEPVAEEPVAP
jgi:hypothetical protein